MGTRMAMQFSRLMIDRLHRLVDTDMKTLFRRRPPDADSNCPKMGQSKRGVEEGGFKIGGVDVINNYYYYGIAC